MFGRRVPEEEIRREAENNLIKKEQHFSLLRLIFGRGSPLSERQQDITNQIYFEGKTRREVADSYGVREQRVGNIIQTILRKLRNPSDKHKLE